MRESQFLQKDENFMKLLAFAEMMSAGSERYVDPHKFSRWMKLVFKRQNVVEAEG